MSLALRIFIVLNLVIALAFMFVQMTLFATRENWKRRWHTETTEFAAEVKKYSQQVATESAYRVKAENHVIALQKDRSDDAGNIRQLENKITELSAEKQNLQRDLARQQTDYNALKDDMNQTTASLTQARQRNSELSSIANVTRAAAFNLNVKLAELEDDNNNLQTELTRRTEDLNKRDDELKKANAFIAQVREKHPKVYDGLKDESGNTQALSAIVTGVAATTAGKKPEFVTLSLGTSSGVQEGEVFFIYRDSTYICKARVERTLADISHARIIPSSWNEAPGVDLKSGDKATNHL
ncbi:MAG: hypothetical protein AAB263_19670 [Planctomycetota bacterium]